ncbi:hypothetical protein [Streptosporangium canum]|uniref:hypothetical protein n=1 Tax=Streptosporangium canum TaxID=324952 RepID=UPI0037A87F22
MSDYTEAQRLGLEDLKTRLHGTFVAAVRLATPSQVAAATRKVEETRRQDPTLVESMEQFWRSGEDPARASA